MVRFETESWLADFVKSRSEEAFAKVVEAHSGLVMATGLRKVGSRAVAEEVMQEVFVLLAKKAGVLVKGEVVVSAWLYRQTCRLASNRVRGEVRRKRREEEFEAMRESGISNGNVMMEEIDAALAKLTEKERELVICRYVEERDFAEMGRRFGMSGEAARKKVARAVEKLRGVLEKRGVGVSASALAVALLGLSGPKASAATVAEVSGVALNKGVAGGTGVLSIGGILAGALAVSVVVGGAKMMDDNEVIKSPQVEQGRVRPLGGESVLRRLSERGLSGVGLSDEEIWADLVALDGEPMTMVTDLLLERVLKSVPGERFFEFVDQAEDHVSLRLKKRICFALLERAVESNPEGTVEGILSRELFTMATPKIMYNYRLGNRAVMFWSKVELAGASEWVIGNWARLEELGGAGSYIPGMYSKRRRTESQFLKAVEEKTVADAVGQEMGWRHFHAGGFEAVEEFVANFDAETAVLIWKPLFFNPGGLKEGKFYPVKFAEKLATFPHEEPYGELKEISWRRWFESWGHLLLNDEDRTKRMNVSTEEYLRALPPHLGADFKRSYVDGLPETKEGGGE